MFTLIFGIFALAFGIWTLYLRLFKDSEGLGKLEPMIKQFGMKIGTAIHVVCYTIVPILVGIVLLLQYFLLGE